LVLVAVWVILLHECAAARKAEYDAVIVGGGLTGLSLAHQLKKAGIDKFVVCEGSSRLGGNVISRKMRGGFLIEQGPNSFQPVEEMLEVVSDLDLSLVYSNPKLPRFVYHGGKMHRLPSSLKDFLSPSFTLLSGWAKARLAIGMVGFRKGKPHTDDESVKGWFERNLGPCVYAKIVEPFVSGVYAGDASRLAMRSAFPRIAALEQGPGTAGILWGALARARQRKRAKREYQLPSPPPRGALASFEGGIEQLPRALAEKLGRKACRTGWRCVDIAKDNKGGDFVTTFRLPFGRRRRVTSKVVALALPAHRVSGPLRHLVPEASELSSIPHPFVATVALAYPDDAFRQPLRGFGNLIPRSEGLRHLGSIYASSLFPGRAPKGWQMLTNFVGGSHDPAAEKLSNRQLSRVVDRELRKTVLRDGYRGRGRVLGVKRWPSAIPQPGQGHEDLLSRVQAGVSRHVGLFVDGSWSSGISVGDRIKAGKLLAADVLNAVIRKRFERQ